MAVGNPQPQDRPAPAPKTSVVIVSFNCAGALRRCLAALERAAGRENFEVIVVDCGSRDESPQVETEFPWTNFLRLPRNFGLTRARNIGSRTATGDYVLYLAPDVEVLPDTVAALAAALGDQPEAVAVNAVLVDPAGTPATVAYPLPAPRDLYRIWKSGAWLAARPVDPVQPTPVEWVAADAMLTRTQFVRGLNYFDERYSWHWSDLELCWQIRRSGKKNLLLPHVHAVRHPDDGGRPPADAQGLLSADQALGAAAYAGKHYGWLAGVRFHLAVVFASLGGLLGSLLRARDLRFHLSRFGAVVTGQRIDGSQSSL